MDPPLNEDSSEAQHDRWENEFFPTSESDEAKLRFLMRYAVLAPSSRNAQPWIWEVSDGRVDLYADRDRALPVSDPAGRELVIGCGAALLHLRAAMRHFGHEDMVELFPSAHQPDLLARVRLGEPLAASADWEVLFSAMPQRHTNRQPFQETPLPGAMSDLLGREAATEGAWLHITHRGPQHETLLNLIVHGAEMQWHDAEFRREWTEWVRSHHSRSSDGIPGSAVGLGKLDSLIAPFAARLHDDTERRAARDRLLLESAPALAVLGTANNTPLEWLNAGQALARVLLRASAAGVSASFFNQPVEISHLEPRLSEVIRSEGFPQLVFRLGYPTTESAPTPRRSLSEVTTYNIALHHAIEHFRRQ